MMFYLKTLIYIEVLMLFGLAAFRYALTPQYRTVVSGSTVVLGLFTPVVALFCGNFFIFCGYLVVAVAFNSRSRTELAGNFAFLLPLMPIMSTETGVGSIYLFAFSTVLAMSLGALIGLAVTGNRKSLAVGRYDLAMVALVGIFMYISSRDANLTVLLRGLTVNIISIVGPYLLISRSIRHAEDVERLLLRLCLGGLLTAVIASFQATKHWVLFETYYNALHVTIPISSAYTAMRGGMLRTGGSMVDYSAAGLFLAAVLTLTPLLRARLRPLGYWFVVIILTFGLVATQSRGAWVAAIVGMLFMLAIRGQWGRLILVGGGAVAALVTVRLFATSGRLAATFGQTEQATSTVSYRQTLAARGIEQIKAHPLFGQNTDQLVANLIDLTQGQHIVDFVNGHLYIAMTAGVPLFLVWCWVWLMPMVEAWRDRSRDGVLRLTVASAAIIVPAMTALTFTSTSDRNLTWPMIALGLAGPCVVLARRGGVSSKRLTLVPTSRLQPQLT